MSQKPKNTQQQQQSQRAAVAARRHATRRERELRRQRRIIIVAGTAVGLSLLAILAGIVYEQLWLPSRPVAQVGSVTLNRGDYWRERRAQSAGTVGQSLFLSTFGEQFAQQFLGQIGQVDAEVPQIRSAAVDEAAVNVWAEQQIIVQRAASLFNLQATDSEIAQALVGDYGTAFATTTAVTPTVGTLPTLPPLDAATPAAEAALTPEAGTPAAGTPAAGTPSAGTPAAGTPLATATAAGPTATPAPSATPPPTETPLPTPLADVALRQQDELITTMYDRYTSEITRIDGLRKPQLTKDDFRNGLRIQFQRQVLVEKVQQQLVPDASFSESSEPSSIRVRHILVKVTSPTSDSAALEQAFSERRAAAVALLARARGGEDFEALARENSEDYATRDAGGELPGFDPTGKTTSGTQIDTAIVAAVAGLEPGQVATELVRTSYGWHIVQLVDRTFESREDQLRRKRTEVFDAWLAQQRAELIVQRFPPVSPTPIVPPTDTPGPLPTQDLGAEPTPTAIPSPTALPEPSPLAPAATPTP